VILEVVALACVATVQDMGRPGRMHQGVPPGGPLVPELLARANAAAGNAYEEAAIELVGAMTVVPDEGVTVATCDGGARTLSAGEAWVVRPVGQRGAHARYLAVRGGIEVPVVLGGRGTLVVAGFGGHEGRPLRKGDRLRIGRHASYALPSPPLPDLQASIRVVPGPDNDRFSSRAIDALLGGHFVIHPRSDRVGTRLVGPPLERADEDTGVSAPMVRGAIQVPASGEAIVLGPDHPTTGGYPVIATVVRSSLGTLAARPPGAPVRFALG
jgi:5-oxoprolinase (ATP-hydrolysing) subunit C